MHNTDFHIQILERPGALDKEVYISYREGGKIMLVGFDQGNMIEKIVTPGAVKENPTMILSDHLMQELLRALLDYGIKPTDQSKTEGLYEAQSEHLKDLRTMLKLK